MILLRIRCVLHNLWLRQHLSPIQPLTNTQPNAVLGHRSNARESVTDSFESGCSSIALGRGALHNLWPRQHLADPTSHQQNRMQCSVIAQTPANLSQTVLKVVGRLLINRDRQLIEEPGESLQQPKNQLTCRPITLTLLGGSNSHRCLWGRS
ncbi:hypothetical protein CDAR_552381 [Caerostris darwini]|uniref:Uncharacterized protein n=1 Tax=Caerostris darwini TaxID=1538125 RepID=A0AAV4NKD1_9ARAC|nr:hypothetical protein CDAR_552381 [Caerostris darwini]